MVEVLRVQEADETEKAMDPEHAKQRPWVWKWRFGCGV
jgi:hypothetical protein